MGKENSVIGFSLIKLNWIVVQFDFKQKEKILKKTLSRNAFKSKEKMEDINDTVDWLIKPESDAITGQVIYLGGV